MAGGAALWLVEAVADELLLFAAAGLLIGGLDDLAVDLIWVARTLWRRLTVYRRHPRATVATLPPPARPGRIAVFVGAWDEAEVIGPMLRTALAKWGAADFRVYVGVYPNDEPTFRIVDALAAEDARVRAVMGLLPGPTTKAEALNRCWHQLLDDEAREGWRCKAIVLHDAEDVVHRDEIALFASLIERFHLVQLPVLPILDATSSWVAAHYGDEFAESHSKQMVVREAVGAGVPAAGTGCAISRGAIAHIAAANGGAPFDGDCLTEDYEIGLRLADFGGRAAFVRIAASGGRTPVAVRAHFPDDFAAAVRQKARWMNGIALCGWDRLGWRGGPIEAWMRLRDRRAPIAALVLAAAYAGLVLMVVAIALRLAEGLPAAAPWRSDWLGMALGALLLWRAAMRALFVGEVYGWREGLRAIPRLVVANIVLMAAARRALTLYIRNAPLVWDKTLHRFPAETPAE